jgi:hypothetical protein
LKKEGQPDVPARIDLPASRQKFFLTISRIKLNDTRVATCARVLQQAADAIRKNKTLLPQDSLDSYSLQRCTDSYDMQVKTLVEGEAGQTYQGAQPFFFKSAATLEAFNLYGNNRFTRVEEFDSGTVAISEGHCERIEPPK